MQADINSYNFTNQKVRLMVTGLIKVISEANEIKPVIIKIDESLLH